MNKYSTTYNTGDIEDFTNEDLLMNYLQRLTGHECEIATATGRYWGSEDDFCRTGTYYQIMSDHEFFDWYSSERPHNQFFKNAQAAALYYLEYFLRWKNKESH